MNQILFDNIWTIISILLFIGIWGLAIYLLVKLFHKK